MHLSNISYKFCCKRNNIECGKEKAYRESGFDFFDGGSSELLGLCFLFDPIAIRKK